MSLTGKKNFISEKNTYWPFSLSVSVVKQGAELLIVMWQPKATFLNEICTIVMVWTKLI